MRIQLCSVILAVAFSSTLGLGVAWGQTQQPPQQKKAEWKDRAEYDLVQSIDKAQEPKKKLELLDQWTKNYPNTDFKVSRLEQYLNVYRQLNDAAKMLDAAQELLKEDPKNINGLYWTCLLIPTSTPDKLDLGEKAANTVLGNPEIFAADKKPQTMDDAAWKQVRNDAEVAAHRGLGWVYFQRKNFPEAEKQLTEDLKMNPNDAQGAYWLGTVILSQKKPERQPDAIYQFARAAAYEGPGAMPPDRRKQIEAYVLKAYTTYHGQDPQGFQQLLATAKTSAFPPAGFKVLSEEEVKEQHLQAAAKNNPSLPFWVKFIKDPLSGPDGAQIFENNVKNAIIPPEGQPPLQATVISCEPARNPKKVLLGIENPKVADVTLNFETPMPGRAEPGTIIKFRGVASAFTREPFMVTFDTEKKNITDWPAPPPPAKKAPVRKGTRKK